MVAEPLKESHVTYGERFYATRLRVPRLSHACDLLPITISERLLSGYMPQVDSIVTIIGQLRSYNQYIDCLLYTSYRILKLKRRGFPLRFLYLPIVNPLKKG